MLKESRIIPIYHPSTPVFVDRELVKPWIEPGTNFKTSAFKFDTRVSMLGVATTRAMLDTGAANVTDSVHPQIGLNLVFYRLKGSAITLTADVARRPKSAFFKPSSYQLKNNADLKSFQSALDFKTDLSSGEGTGRIWLKGGIDLQTSELIMTVASSDVELLGYTLLAYRSNLNRQAVPIID